MNISVGTSGIIFVAINPQISPMQPRARRINSFQWLVPSFSAALVKMGNEVGLAVLPVKSCSKSTNWRPWGFVLVLFLAEVQKRVKLNPCSILMNNFSMLPLCKGQDKSPKITLFSSTMHLLAWNYYNSIFSFAWLERICFCRKFVFQSRFLCSSLLVVYKISPSPLPPPPFGEVGTNEINPS